MTQSTERTRAASLASAMGDHWEPDELGYQRHRSVIQARRHLASLTSERRAFLQAEWNSARDVRALVGEQV